MVLTDANKRLVEESFSYWKGVVQGLDTMPEGGHTAAAILAVGSLLFQSSVNMNENLRRIAGPEPSAAALPEAMYPDDPPLPSTD